MRTDICKWCRACITCATRQTGRATRPPLVDGPFDRIGVDVIQFPKSKKGNRYQGRRQNFGYGGANYINIG